jgi:hypothetical protein
MDRTFKPAARILAILIVGCSIGVLGCDDSTEPGSGATVLGRLTLPANAPGSPYVVMVDTDTNGDNGSVASTTGICGDTREVSYSIANVAEGTYYVYAAVGAVSDLSSGPQTGDFYGFFGTGGTEPASPNAAVPASGSVSFNINLSVF